MNERNTSKELVHISENRKRLVQLHYRHVHAAETVLHPVQLLPLLVT